MKEFNGTKGEWEVRPTPNDDDFSHEITTPGTSVAVLRQYNDDPVEEEANANLIAAAPNLLAACQEMVSACCGDQESEEELLKGLGAPMYNAMLKLKSAISKALPND